MSKAAWRLFQPFLVVHVIIAIGIVGYILIEDYNLLDAIYMTTITVTTAGFMEVKPLSVAGRAFTTILLITSWASFAFVLTRITQYVISGEINQFFKTI